MIPKLLITGCRGMLGSQIVTELSSAGKYELTCVDREEGDLADVEVCKAAFQHSAPDIVINAAAFTRVDDCETDQGAASAESANVRLPANLAAACNDSGALLVHISTDYVYDGKKSTPYVESDPPAPLSVYGRSKLRGDLAVLESGCRCLILRTAWLFGPGGHNFVEAILRQAEKGGPLKVVDDQFGSPTSTADLSRALAAALDVELEGLFHFACAGQTNWHGFASAIVEKAGFDLPVLPLKTAELGLPAPRPQNSRLDCSAIDKALGIHRRSWQEALEQYLRLRG